MENEMVEYLKCIENKIDQILTYLTQKETAKIAPTNKPVAAKNNPSKINNTVIPDYIQDQITIAETTNNYVIKKPWSPDKGAWVEINNFIQAVGGEWHSAGRDSHWTIPKKA